MAISALGAREDMGIVDVPTTDPSIPRDTGMPAMVIGCSLTARDVPFIATSLGEIVNV